jgi:estrogen-related receptor beta like 1
MYDRKLELERVFPKLKLNSSAATALQSREWRSHIDQASNHNSTLTANFPSTKQTLDKISNNLKKQLDVILSKEKQINREYEAIGNEFRDKQRKSQQVQDIYNQLQGSVAELNNELQLRTDEVEQIKQQMTEKNNNMTDTQPLRKLQNSLANLKKESDDLELRIGVTGQTLLQAKMKSHNQTLQQQQRAIQQKHGNVKANREQNQSLRASFEA